MQQRAPSFGFPVVASRVRDARTPFGGAEFVHIRYGADGTPGLASLDDPRVHRALGLDRLVVPAAKLFGEENLYAGWSVSAEHQESTDLLIGASGQLAALLALASSPTHGCLTRPGLLDAGVIWATGAVTLKGAVVPVREDDFVIKLHAFLRSPDSIFMAPESDWTELRRGEGSALLQGITLLTLSELRATSDLPSRDWRGSHARPLKWGIRVPEGPAAGLLDAMFSNVHRRESHSAISSQLAATVRFDHTADALRHRPADASRLEAFLRAAKELGDWLLATDELGSLLAGLSPQDGAGRALAYASAVSRYEPGAAEPLWRRVLEQDPGSTVAGSSLMQLLRTEGRTDEILALLSERASRAHGTRAERAAALAERAEILSGLGRPVDAFGEWLAALKLDPGASAVLDRIAATLLHDEGAVTCLEGHLADASDELIGQILGRLLQTTPSAGLARVDAIVARVKATDLRVRALRGLACLASASTEDRDFGLRTYVRILVDAPSDPRAYSDIVANISSPRDIDTMLQGLLDHMLEEAAQRVLLQVGCDRRRPAATRFHAILRAAQWSDEAAVAENLGRALLDTADEFSPEEAGHALERADATLPFAVRFRLIDRSLACRQGEALVAGLLEAGGMLRGDLRRPDHAVQYYRRAFRILPSMPLLDHARFCDRVDESVCTALQEWLETAGDPAEVLTQYVAARLESNGFSAAWDRHERLLLGFDDWTGVAAAFEAHDAQTPSIRADRLIELALIAVRRLRDPHFALHLWNKARLLAPRHSYASSTLQEIVARLPDSHGPRIRWRSPLRSRCRYAGWFDGAVGEYTRSLQPGTASGSSTGAELSFPIRRQGWEDLAARLPKVPAVLLTIIKDNPRDRDALSELLNWHWTSIEPEEAVLVLCHCEAVEGGGARAFAAADIALMRLGHPWRALELYRLARTRARRSAPTKFTLQYVVEPDGIANARRALEDLISVVSEDTRDPATLLRCAAVAELIWDCCGDARRVAAIHFALLEQKGDFGLSLDALVRLAHETPDLSWVYELAKDPSYRSTTTAVRDRLRQRIQGDLVRAPDIQAVLLVSALHEALGDLQGAFNFLLEHAGQGVVWWRYRAQVRRLASTLGRFDALIGQYRKALHQPVSDEQRQILNDELARTRRSHKAARGGSEPRP